MDRAVLVDSEDIKKLTEKIGDVDKRIFHMENVIPELAENVKALTRVVTNQAVQDEFNRNIDRRVSQSEKQIENLTLGQQKNTASIWKIIAYLAAGAGCGISIANLFPF